jgi:hypothetical protein
MALLAGLLTAACCHGAFAAAAAAAAAAVEPGTGSLSIYGSRFADEPFVAKHTGPGG